MWLSGGQVHHQAQLLRPQSCMWHGAWENPQKKGFWARRKWVSMTDNSFPAFTQLWLSGHSWLWSLCWILHFCDSKMLLCGCGHCHSHKPHTGTFYFSAFSLQQNKCACDLKVIFMRIEITPVLFTIMHQDSVWATMKAKEIFVEQIKN